jgi:tRNA (guanine37-N1)-methyltransferase
MIKFDVLTLFPNMFDGFLSESIIKRAIEDKLLKVDITNFRDYSDKKNNQVDDTPYGGGDGMVLMCDPIVKAIEEKKKKNTKVILMSPQGEKFTQKKAIELSKESHLIFVCGHYEGFDERIKNFVDEEISIGDYVLTGGEIPAMAISDSIIRLIDDVISEESPMDDSYINGLLEYPQYTRPYVYKGKAVPDVLISGNHKNIREYRLKESLRKTYLRRPDLLEKKELTKEEEKLLKEIKEEL